MSQHLKSPVPFSPEVETIPEDEAETIAELNETMGKIRQTTYEHSGHAMRSVHAKSHGYLVGELTIEPGLAAEFAQGLFAGTGAHPVLMRFSTNPGDILDDKVSVPRGLAIKVLGADGPRLSGQGSTQDFVLANGPAFTVPTPKKFLQNLKLLAKTTDKGEGAKIALSATLQAVEKVVEAFGGKSSTLVSLGGHAETHVLGESYFSQAPLRFGDFIAKLSVVPISAGLTALTDQKVDLKDKPDGLRQAVVDFFSANGGQWAVKVQLCRDLEAMPIEDASVVWPEEDSPYVTVGTITVQPQSAWTEARAAAVDDGMMFSPWHGLQAHQPLGGVMRSRKLVYEKSAEFRAARLGRPMEEPSAFTGLPS
ncbi:MAG: catalase [Rubrivivax sp.]|nr:MAG: catalase [Rubrivivax sp.]